MVSWYLLDSQNLISIDYKNILKIVFIDYVNIFLLLIFIQNYPWNICGLWIIGNNFQIT